MSAKIESYIVGLRTAEEYELKHNIPNEEVVYFSVFWNDICLYHYFKKIVYVSIYLEEITEIFKQNACNERHH